MQHRLIDEFLTRAPLFHALQAELQEVFTRLVADLGGGVHALSSRIKGRDSLAGKLARPDRTYHTLTDITDLVGVRIITYFEDGVRDVARRVEQIFDVDLGRSVDRRRQVELDRFGYRSLHYICAPPEGFFTRHDLEPLPALRFEVQLRTILQHAWAEMEHDLGYKSTGAIPAQIRRRFSRLAGLLELADEEFLDIKRDLDAYEDEVSANLERDLAALPLDRVSLRAFLDDPRVRHADEIVAGVLGEGRSEEAFFPDYLVEMLSLVGLDRIAALKDALCWATPRLSDFVPRYFLFTQRAWKLSPQDIGPVQKGYGLLFVAHMCLLDAARLDVERVEEATRFFLALDHPDDRDAARALAVLLVDATRPG